MLGPLAAVGSPKEVAADIVARFGGLVDRVGFYTPYLVADETLGELVAELGPPDVPAHDRRCRHERRPGGALRRVLAVRRERHRGRPALGRAAHGAAASSWRWRPAAGSAPWCGAPDRPSSSSSTAAARTPTPGTPWPWPSTGRWWPSTCPATATRTGRATPGRSIRGPWPTTWPSSSTALAPSARLVVGMSLGGLTSIALAAPTRRWCRRLALVDITPGVDREKSSDIAAFLAGPGDVRLLRRDPRARTIQFNPTRSESSLRRGVLHNAVQRDDGTWTWRHQLGRPAGATGLHVGAVEFGSTVGRPRAHRRCRCCWSGARCPRWWTTPTRPSSTGAGPADRVIAVDERRPQHPGRPTRWSWPASSADFEPGP